VIFLICQANEDRENNPENLLVMKRGKRCLLLYLLKKYYTQAGDQDDLISIGTIGLIKGISTFKADKKVRLATYASRCVENAILSQRIPFRRSRKKYSQLAENGVSCPTLAAVWG
jgi:DNA-directed RNA polymerase specialized sigma subunit